MRPVGLLQNRNFRLHWASVAITQTGGSFTTVALPWLVLSVTGDDAFIMSTVLGTLSVPTGVFLLFGGALADRFSPLRTLWVSRATFAALMLSLAVCSALGAIPISLLYAYALFLGVVIAIGIPASQALLPALVPQDDLGKANGVLFGTLHVAQVLGPFAAGWLIFWGRQQAGGPAPASSAQGIAPAFAVDAGLTILALVLMALMRVDSRPAPRLRIWPFIREGLDFCRRDRGICTVLIYLMLASLFLQGPLMVSLPLITKVNLGLFERTLGA
ncbi:MAG TPA: MFS transporter, partial [Polyangiaceae bacterium]|nr:MFS transporter [Polyangiaceae bacterium]